MLEYSPAGFLRAYRTIFPMLLLKHGPASTEAWFFFFLRHGRMPFARKGCSMEITELDREVYLWFRLLQTVLIPPGISYRELRDAIGDPDGKGATPVSRRFQKAQKVHEKNLTRFCLFDAAALEHYSTSCRVGWATKELLAPENSAGKPIPS